MSTQPAYSGDPRDLLRFWDRGGEPPRVCVWEVTLRCDLACRHCGSRAGPARADELTTAEALHVVRQLAELGVREVILIGGEAYLRDDWIDIARAVTDAGMVCTMVTGGYAFDALHAEEARSAGVTLIGVSLDGIAATHDHLRGRVGAFEAAVAAAGHIRSAGLGLSVNSQLNRLSVPELPALARLIVSLGAAAWQIQLTVALGRAADRPDLLLQPFHMLALMPMLSDIKRTILDPGGVELFLGNNVGYFGPFESELRYGGRHGAAWNGCMAGRAAIGLEADGTLKGCPSLPTRDYGAGSVRDNSVAALWRDSDRIGGLGRRTRQDLWGFCATCEHGDRCLGGCTWTAHALFGRPGNNPYCYHRAATLAAANRRERLVQVEPAPGVPFDFGRFALVEEAVDAGPDAELDLALGLVPLLGEGRSGWSAKRMSHITAKRARAQGAAS